MSSQTQTEKEKEAVAVQEVEEKTTEDEEQQKAHEPQEFKQAEPKVPFCKEIFNEFPWVNPSNFL